MKHDSAKDTARAASGPGRVVAVYLLAIVLLALLWMAFSGKFDPLHMGYGALSIILVMILSRRLILRRDVDPSQDWIPRVHWGWALAYPFWLGWQILLANLQVAWIVIDPRLPIDPVLLRFRCGMGADLAKVVLGNSITLTPGTFTLLIEGDCFLVHCIHPKLAGGLMDGSMQRKVAQVFGEALLSEDEMQMEVIRDMERYAEEHIS